MLLCGVRLPEIGKSILTARMHIEQMHCGMINNDDNSQCGCMGLVIGEPAIVHMQRELIAGRRLLVAGGRCSSPPDEPVGKMADP